MLPIARSSRIVFALAVAAFLAGPARAATPRDELLHYVPEQVGFCLVLNDLRGHSDALVNSPFVEHFLQTQLGKNVVRAHEVAQLLKLEKDLKALLGIDWPQLRDDIFGDAVVLAYRPGPPGKPEGEQGLILLHARDAKLLARTIDQLNAKQKESGDLKALAEKRYKGAAYFQRTEKKDTTFYYLDGSILLFTGQEEFLRQALDQGKDAKKDAESAVACRFRALEAAQTLLSLWINPRAFDAALEADLTNPKKTEAERAFAEGFAPYWKALDSVVISVALEKDFKVRVGFQARMDALPAAARRFFREAAKPSELWSAIPDDAMFAVAGRLDLPALFEMLGDFMPEASRKSARRDLNRTVAALLGKEDFFKEVLPHIGPEFGLYFSAPPAQGKSWFPESVLAVSVGAGKDKPAFNQAVISTIDRYASTALLAYNKLNPSHQLALKTVLQGKREVKYLVNDRGFPPGLQPAVALHDGFIFFASSPEALRRFAETRAPDGDGKANEVPLLRVSFKELLKWLRDRQDALTPIVAEQNKLTLEEARQRLAQLLGGLELIDRLEITQRATPGQIVFTLTLQTGRPLRK